MMQINRRSMRSTLARATTSATRRLARSSIVTRGIASSAIDGASASIGAGLASSGRRVFGIGVDVAHIPRFASVYARQGAPFLRKCLHPAEIEHVRTMEQQINDATTVDSALPTPAAANLVAAYLASRWAVKEAMIKASGQRLLFPEMRITRATKSAPVSAGNSVAGVTAAAVDPRPRMQLSGAAAAWFASSGLHPHPLVTLSHDGEYAIGFVCIECEHSSEGVVKHAGSDSASAPSAVSG
jgi:phosphopantetheine--protein transferase-like protein